MRSGVGGGGAQGGPARYRPFDWRRDPRHRGRVGDRGGRSRRDRGARHGLSGDRHDPGAGRNALRGRPRDNPGGQGIDASCRRSAPAPLRISSTISRCAWPITAGSWKLLEEILPCAVDISGPLSHGVTSPGSATGPQLSGPPPPYQGRGSCALSRVSTATGCPGTPHQVLRNTSPSAGTTPPGGPRSRQVPGGGPLSLREPGGGVNARWIEAASAVATCGRSRPE